MSIKTISKRASDKMSKQPHEQEEQKASDGAQSATSGDGAGKGGTAGRRRSRRYDKANQDRSRQEGTSQTGAQGGQAAAASATSGSHDKADAKAASGSAGEADKGKETGGKPAASGADTADKPGANDKAGASQSSAKAAPSNRATGGGNATPAAPAAGGGGGKGGKAGAVAIALVILLAIAAALFGWQAWQKLEAQQARIAELETRTSQAATASDLDALQARFEEAEAERQAALEEAIASLESDFSDYRGEVDETLDRVLAELSSEQQTDERDWLHAEAAYLLRLANQRLQLERDVEGAAALLRTADARLKEADNPALVPVRREIASELAALESVPEVDRTGLWLALNAQQEQIAGQPLSQEIEEITARSSMQEAPSGTWQQQLSRFGQELKDLVTVRQHDEALEALISPEQESYLRQSVRLVIEQAQLALLKEEPELYQASLEKAITLIEGYYDTGASGVQSVLERLAELKGAAVRPELPDISASQQALAEFIERRFESRQGDEA
ncbi:uroporphyrin-3 C-methyltransferase [Halomonas shengliensis]|uniref:Uroporphyrin-3 C-methyltransferase n=2 Tax=Halomonas shengliensis TaxID=419597 RepID=A0A1H0JIT9_9GAMM|nr:uroporphyrin-3 C-methyltransferase [Halomonas shengliensis]